MTAATFAQRHNGRLGYVSIETAKQSLDVALNPDMKPADSLRRQAADWRIQAQRLIRNAALLEGVAADMDARDAAAVIEKAIGQQRLGAFVHEEVQGAIADLPGPESGHPDEYRAELAKRIANLQHHREMHYARARHFLGVPA
jgi:hypothetical protein